MAPSSSSRLPPPQLSGTSVASVLLSSLLILFFAPLLPSVSSLSFNFSDFFNNQIARDRIRVEGDAVVSTSWTARGISLTQPFATRNQSSSVGRAVHTDPLLLWDAASGNLTDFVTHFSFFIVNSTSKNLSGDGFAFFLAPYPAYEIPDHSDGEGLGLFNNSASRTVAVEFDTYCNPFDPRDDFLSHHVGIDILSKKSVAYTILSGFTMVRNNTAHATVSYNASTMNLSVILYYDPNVTKRSWSTSTTIDLRRYLPEKVSVGFSGATGDLYEMHTIVSWDFSSRLENKTSVLISQRKKHKLSTRSCLEVFLGVLIFLCGLCLSCFALWRRRRIRRQNRDKDDEEELLYVDGGGLGPRSFLYDELVTATRNFADEGKLGEGGFGSVYLGVLPAGDKNNELQVAIKRISRGSMQGKKEYLSEVTIISKLRHRNLVQLIGYCHEKGEFFLVYQFMTNRSLDSHLYSNERLLGWQERYKIATGLASALLYLHEEWEQCVVHRDIKPSNVMLDEDFTPKLGDFGLARLVDHGNSGKMTVLAGTKGYMAPEYEETGKASKESDVYGFGVVALEIACGRRPIDLRQAPSKVSLIGWVRDLYEKRMCLAAADRRLLNEGFDEQLMERLMVVGLWCAHTDYKMRPSIRRVVGVLRFDAPLPVLPPLTKTFTQHNYTSYSSSTSGTTNSACSSSSLAGV